MRNKSSMLLGAARAGNIAKVNELVQAGANKEGQNNNGDTALNLASLSGHLDVV
jgi:ankyrin repeat protein